MPPGSHGPTDPASNAASDLGRSPKRTRSSSHDMAARENQSSARKSTLSEPVTSS